MNSAKKKSFFVAVVCLILCVALLIGTTFAWFTDSVSNTGNRIQAGTLDVDLLMYKTTDPAGYKSIAGGTGDIFNEAQVARNSNETLWEPGKTQIVYLAVENKGNLALKYKTCIDVTDNGLAGSLEYALLEGTYDQINPHLSGKTWPDIKTAAGTNTGLVAAGRTEIATGILDEIVRSSTANERDYVALAVHMNEDADNQYQGKNIIIDVNILAAQMTAESDGFSSDQYDSQAVYPALAPYINDSTTQTGSFAKTDDATKYVKTNASITISATDVGAVSQVKNNTELYTGDAGTTPIVTGKAENQFNSDLTRTIKTVSATENSVTYNIGYVYTETVDSVSTSYPVTGFSEIVSNEITLASGLKNVTVTHSHNGTPIAMTKLTQMPQSIQDSTYYYDAATGKLYIWSKLYSEFGVSYEYDYVASIGTVGYTSLKDALKAAEDSDVVMLLKDTDESVTIDSEDITLNGNGNKISVNNGTAITLTAKADGTVLKNVYAESANGIALVVEDGAEAVTIEAGTYKTAVSSGAGKQGEGAIRFMGNNENVSVTGASLLGGLHILNYAEGNITATGNTFAVDSTLKDRTDIVCGILIYGSGANAQAANGPAYLSGNTYSESQANYKVLIQGADWTTYYSDKASVQIAGKGCYDTLEAAVEAAEDEDTINLLKDITLTADITIDKSLTIEKSTFVITGEEHIKAADGCTLTTEGTKIIIKSTMPKKGMLIKMNLVQNDSSLTEAFSGAVSGGNETYRVLKTSGTKALVVAMYETRLGESYYPDAGPVQTVAFEDGTSRTKYAESPLDNYMESTFYSTDNLSANAYNAITSESIYQSAYARNTGSPSGDFKYGFEWLYNGSVNQWKAKYVSQVSVGNRHVYALDLKDIYDYYGKTSVTLNELTTMFYNCNYSDITSSYGPWLRTASGGFPTGETNCAWQMVSLSSMKGLTTYGATWCFNNNPAACPAFTIDLSKLTSGWTKYETN